MTRDEYLAMFQARVILDAWNEAHPAYWRRRASSFRAIGTAACDEIANACENKARFCEIYPVVSGDAA